MKVQRAYSSIEYGRNLTYQNMYKVIRSNCKVSILGPSEAIDDAGVKWKLESGQHRKWCGEAVMALIKVYMSTTARTEYIMAGYKTSSFRTSVYYYKVLLVRVNALCSECEN